MEIFEEYAFEAAHRLPNVPAGHKCERLHGHSYRVAVHITGPVDDHAGWVRDFADLADAMRPILDRLDHYYLNEVEGLENPTSEVLAMWIFENLKPALPALTAIVVHDDQFEVIGAGKVGVFDSNGVAKKKYLTLSKGQKFDLKKRVAIQ
jgi:6-pyruvoyltetrahydropterin/6-carboxytetrahydropterin synthase